MLIKIQKSLFFLAFGCALVAANNSSYADTIEAKVVRDVNDDPVRNTFDNCVITKWQTDRNICHVMVETKAPAPAPKQAVVFSEEERTVFFDFNSSKLSQESKQRLDALMQKVKGSGQIYDGLIVGYADRIGSQSYNLALSKRRAESVEAYLRNSGLPISGVEVRFMGEDKSVTACGGDLPRSDLIACLAKDRRVTTELQLRAVSLRS